MKLKNKLLRRELKIKNSLFSRNSNTQKKHQNSNLQSIKLENPKNLMQKNNFYHTR